METGTLGERRQAEFDALYAEAKETLAQGANRLRAVTERLREDYATGLEQLERQGGDGTDLPEYRRESQGLARDKALLARLELALHDMEQSWSFLERGLSGEWKASGRSAVDEPPLETSDTATAMQILEAQEQERAHVAADLHDGPAQALANAVFQVDIVDRALRSDPQVARAELLNLRTQLQRELSALRDFIHQLHPSITSGESLEEALRELGDQLAQDGVPVDLRLEAPAELLDAPRSTAVLRVAQEALRNVRKHAAATRVRVSTFLAPSGNNGQQRWILEVVDNGAGFGPEDPTAHSGQRHFGLRFMRERAQLIGARLDVISHPGQGTTVRLALEPARRS